MRGTSGSQALYLLKKFSHMSDACWIQNYKQNILSSLSVALIRGNANIVRLAKQMIAHKNGSYIFNQTFHSDAGSASECTTDLEYSLVPNGD